MEQGKTLEKLGERDESSGCYLNAAKSYKKEFPKGRFSTAANNQKQIAEIYEQDIGDMKAAMDAYETAAEWYSGEDSNAQANQCLLKVAQFAGTLEEYERAVDLFERVAAKSLDNNLTKWSVREYLFKAFICVLCINDSVRSKSTLDKYLTMDPSFKGTRECALCTSLLETIEAGDSEAFTAALQDFDRMTKLDEWKTSLLLRVKKSIEEDEEDYT
ncbi:vesicular-fusion protein S17 [Kappamyces sp. JEL0829]|nr:vesicular-fusion protein S17 [Kappamyces sp. JEL0829]